MRGEKAAATLNLSVIVRDAPISPTASENAGHEIENNRNLIIKIPQPYKYFTPF